MGLVAFTDIKEIDTIQMDELNKLINIKYGREQFALLPAFIIISLYNYIIIQ